MNPEVSKKTGKRPSPGEVTKPPTSDGELDRIRDILFGRQAEAIDARLRSLESQTRDDNAALRSDTAKRLASLELYVKGEVTAISERLRTEADERTRGIRHLARELREGLEAIEKRVTAAAAQTEEELRLLREQVLHDSQSLRDEIRATSEGAETQAGSLPH